MTANQKRGELLSLMAQAQTAYISGKPSMWLSSSPFDMAWKIGLWLKNTGRTAPRDLSPSRGYDWRVNDMVVSFKKDSNVPERIA